MANSEDLTALRRAVDGFTEQFRKYNDRMDASEKDRRGLHRRNRWLAGGFAFATAVSGLSTWAAVSALNASSDAKSAASTANSAAHAAHQNCVNANAARDNNRDLWNSVLSTLDPLTVTPQGKAFVANLHADVDKLTTHLPCPKAP